MTEYNVGDPTLASVLGLPSAATETTQERVSSLLDEAVYLRTDLAVMPTGPAPVSPADAIAGRQLRVFLEQAAARFDLVIAVAGDARLPTAQVLTQRVGSTLLALAPGKTTVPRTASLVTDLTQQRVRLLGAVMIYGKESLMATVPDAECAAYGEVLQASGHRIAAEALQREHTSLSAGALNPELRDLRLQGRALHPEPRRGACRTADLPVDLLERLTYVLTLGFLERRERARAVGRGGQAPLLQLGERDVERGAARHDDGALDEVLELPDVAGPLVA